MTGINILSLGIMSLFSTRPVILRYRVRRSVSLTRGGDNVLEMRVKVTTTKNRATPARFRRRDWKIATSRNRGDWGLPGAFPLVQPVTGRLHRSANTSVFSYSAKPP